MPKYKVCPVCGTVNSTTSKLQNSDYLFKKFIGFMIDDVTLDVIARNLIINFKTALFIDT